MFDLVFSTPAAGHAVAVRYVLDLQRRGASPEQQRLHLDALADVTARAERFRIGRCRLDVSAVLVTVAQTPLRALRANGGDRRSTRFQRCDTALRRGTVAYFRAWLQRDRLDILAAHEGVPHYVKVGDKVITETRYSDSLLLALLKAHRPGKFRDDGLEEKLSDEEMRSWLPQMIAAYRAGASIRGATASQLL